MPNLVGGNPVGSLLGQRSYWRRRVLHGVGALALDPKLVQEAKVATGLKLPSSRFGGHKPTVPALPVLFLDAWRFRILRLRAAVHD